MALSCFTPCGILRCSSKKPVTVRIYEALKASYGPGFVGPNSDADIYATAMCLGATQVELDRAAGQQDPMRCTEFLSGFEDQYGIIPAADASPNDRRKALAAARKLRNGARLDSMQDGLRGILGSGFVKYITSTGTTPIPASPGAPAAFKKPNSLISVVKLTDVVMPGTKTVAYTHVAGDAFAFKKDDVLVVNPDINGIAEPVTLTASTGDGRSGTITGVFTKPHSAGAHATSAPWPMWFSYQRHVVVVVTPDVPSNTKLMRTVKNFMRKWSRVVTTWDVFPENSPGAGQSGPFYPNIGCPNVTPVGVVTY